MTRRIISKDKGRPLTNYHCGKCQVEIKVGDPYLYWEPYFRSSSKSIRCMKSQCSPRPSERESSLMQEVLSAQESVEDQISAGGQDAASDFEALRDELAEAIESVKDQYTEAAGSFNDAGPNAEKAEELESSLDEVQGLDFDEAPERDDIDVCEGDDASDEELHRAAEGLGPEDTVEFSANVEGCGPCDDLYAEKVDEWRTEQADKIQEVGI